MPAITIRTRYAGPTATTGSRIIADSAQTDPRTGRRYRLVAPFNHAAPTMREAEYNVAAALAYRIAADMDCAVTCQRTGLMPDGSRAHILELDRLARDDA